MATAPRPLALVTGASAGIGYELAKVCAQNGFDLVLAADQPKIHAAAQEFRGLGVEVDLATMEGVDQLYAAARGRPARSCSPTPATGLAARFSTRTFPKR